MQEIQIKTCRSCNCSVKLFPKRIIWDEKGYGYSTKLFKCPFCNQLNIIKYYEDPSLDLNRDTRWYKHN